jgi:hypothetical protein
MPSDDESQGPIPGSQSVALLSSFALSSLGGLLLLAGFNFFLSSTFLIPAAVLVYRFSVGSAASNARGIARFALALAVTGLVIYAVLLGSLVAQSWIMGLKLFGGSLLCLLAPLLMWGLWKN